MFISALFGVPYLSVNEVNEGISRLECNKACGLDGVSAKHLKHCSSRVTPLLAMCITGFMVHGFLPESMMSVVLIPIIKDKKAKISSIDNYRPVAIASVVSKVLERILLERLSEYLDTMGNQFGFKPKLVFYTFLAVLESHCFADVVMNAPGLRLTTWILTILHNSPAFQ